MTTLTEAFAALFTAYAIAVALLMAGWAIWAIAERLRR